MSDDREAPRPAPPAVRALALPWWRARALMLADLMEMALEAGKAGAEVGGRWRPIEWLAAEAEAADAMVERLEAEEAAENERG